MNFLGMGPMELMLILVLALIIFGPGKLPEIAGQVGKVVREFRRTTSELSSEFSRTLSLEIEERKAPAAPTAEAYVAPPVPETLLETTEAPAAPVEASPPMTIHVPEPVAAAPSVPGRRTYDADLAPPY
jgi:sec-independent protein translocase protein TatB